jgi:hypothetical protein
MVDEVRSETEVPGAGYLNRHNWSGMLLSPGVVMLHGKKQAPRDKA